MLPYNLILYNTGVKKTKEGPVSCAYCDKPVNLEEVDTLFKILEDPSEKSKFKCDNCKTDLFLDINELIHSSFNKSDSDKKKVFYNEAITKIQKDKISYLLFLLNVFTVFNKEEYYSAYDDSSAHNYMMQTEAYKLDLLQNYKKNLEMFFLPKLSLLNIKEDGSKNSFFNTESLQIKEEGQKYEYLMIYYQEMLKMIYLVNQIGNIPLFVDENLNYESYFLKELKLYYNFRDYITNRGVNFENIDIEYYKQYKNFLFLDLDGTLATEEGISQETLSYLRELQDKKQLKVIFCSGRPGSSLLFLQKDLVLKPTAIGRNGSEVVYYSKNKELESALRLPYEDPRIKENLQKVMNLSYLTQQKNNSKVIKEIIQVLKIKHKIPVKIFVDETIVDVLTPLDYESLTNAINKAIEKDAHLRSLIENIDGLVVTPVTDMKGHIYTFTHGVSTKGATVKKFIDACNISKEQTFNIGNGYNDISLTEVVGKSYSVNIKNPGEYEKYVDYVSKIDGSEGVKECLEDFFKSNTSAK